MSKTFTFFAFVATLSCGLLHAEQNGGITPFLSGGSAASKNQFPFQVAIKISEGSIEDFCNGALIKHKWVLTSADCIRTGKDYKIILGMLNTASKAWESEKIENSSFTIHPNFNITSKENNIALIYVKDMPVPDGIEVTTIDIPANMNFEGKDVRISGYGITGILEGVGDRKLNYFDSKITSNASCSAIYADAKNSLCVETTSSKTICAGDLGSPMTAEISLKRVLLGIGSLSTTTCISKSKALFENVMHHRAWIEKVSHSSRISLGYSVAAVVIVMICKNFV